MDFRVPLYSLVVAMLAIGCGMPGGRDAGSGGGSGGSGGAGGGVGGGGGGGDDDGGTGGGGGSGGGVGGGSGGGVGGGGGGSGGGDGGFDYGDGGVVDAGVIGDGGTCSARVGYYTDIPMRDGKTLKAWVDRAADPSCVQSVVLVQTPYNINNAKGLWLGANRAQNPLFNSPDYAYVFEDWRGFWGSSAAKKLIATPGLDGYDTVEWVAAQSWTTGKVGTWGASALCGQQYKTAVKKPAHLTAMVPIFCDMNTTFGQVYPGGIYRRELMDFITLYYGVDFYEDNRTQNGLWNAYGALNDPGQIAAPALVVTGWHDVHGAGSVQAYSDLQASSDVSVRGAHRLIGGPWIHFSTGGESAGTRALTAGELVWADPGKEIQKASLAWFDWKLRNLTGDASTWQPVRFLRGNETGFTSSAVWPPSNTVSNTFYPEVDGGLPNVTPTPLGQPLQFTYDPVNPSPTTGGSTLCPTWAPCVKLLPPYPPPLYHGPFDQAAVLARAGDHLSFVSPPLGAALRIQGALRASLQVSTTAVDTDFMVRVTDVDGAGVHTLIAEAARRLSFRSGYSAKTAVTANQPYTLDLVFLNDLAWTVPAGHRIGLIVSSSNYPLFDRNPNDGRDFSFDADAGTTADAGVPATNVLYVGNSALFIPSAP